MQTGYNYGKRVGSLSEIQVHFRRNIADMPFDVPNALPCSTLAVEDTDIVAVRLGIVGANHTQQRTLSRTVRPEQSPTFAFCHLPVHMPENNRSPIAYGAVA